jgi:hypothetical protein
MRKSVLKIAILLGIYFLNFHNMYSQVKGVTYDMLYNKETSNFDIYIVIEKGSAKATMDRIQFNSQVSIVVPTGCKMEIVKFHMPIEDNQKMDGVRPMEWKTEKPLVAPSSAPLNDYYSVFPILIPSSFYNEVNEGDKIKIFSINVKTDNIKGVRFYNKKLDPDASDPSMRGQDFSNAFCIGSPEQIYKGL